MCHVCGVVGPSGHRFESVWFLEGKVEGAFKMIIPVRWLTCGKVIGNKWEVYLPGPPPS